MNDKIKVNEELREKAIKRMLDLEAQGFKKILNPKLTLTSEFVPIEGEFGSNRNVTSGRIDSLLRSVAQNGIIRTTIILAITDKLNMPGDTTIRQFVVDGGGRIFGLCKVLEKDPRECFEFLMCPQEWDRAEILSFMASINLAQKAMSREELVNTFRYKEDYRVLDDTHKKYSVVSIDLCAKAFNPDGVFNRMGMARTSKTVDMTDVRYGNFQITNLEAGRKAIQLVDALIRAFKDEKCPMGKKFGMVFMGELSNRFRENPDLEVDYSGGARKRLSFKNIYAGCKRFLQNAPKEITERWYAQLITEGFRFPPSKRETAEMDLLKEY